jgi:hypothetical protein
MFLEREREEKKKKKIGTPRAMLITDYRSKRPRHFFGETK